MDYSNKCYKKTALSQVIVRIDFLDYIDNDLLLSEAVEKTILPFFPKKGMLQMIKFKTMNFSVNPDGAMAEQTTKDGNQIEFSDNEGNKIVLSNKYIVLEINKYISFEHTVKPFNSILKSIIEGEHFTAIRTGIRYINIYNEDSIKPQKNYFNSPVSALLDNSINADNNCIRTLNLTEYMIDKMRLNFRYGQYNPQYPQTIKKTSFVLDIDCFCDSSLQGYDSIISYINRGHDEIQKVFEAAISDRLKQVMGNE